MTAQPQPKKSADVDWLLQSLVSIVNNGSASIPITLSVGGLLISGDLIGGRTYFDEFARQFKDGFSEISTQTASALEESFKRLGDVYELTRVEADENSYIPEPHLIHLRNVQILNSVRTESWASEGPFLWRGRLGAVDGFSLGRLSTSASS